MDVTLAELAAVAGACTDCRLHEGRTTVVFGDGADDADLMFVGEGPGRHEDEQGLPFVGPSGQLLEQLLGEVGLTRGEVYISNVVKCRPPGNRDPRPDEIDACKHYLADQIRSIDPVVVVTLGNFATKLLLRETRGITRLRGHAYPWWNRTLIPTFHPAAALRGGTKVLDAMRQDFLLMQATLAEPSSDAQVSALDESKGGPSAVGDDPVLDVKTDLRAEPEQEDAVEQLDLFR